MVEQAAYMKMCSALIALLCYTLKRLPENAHVIEKIVFNANVDLNSLIRVGNDLVKTRICMFLLVLGRYCTFALQNVWTSEWKESLESLRTCKDADVRKVCYLR